MENNEVNTLCYKLIATTIFMMISSINFAKNFEDDDPLRSIIHDKTKSKQMHKTFNQLTNNNRQDDLELTIQEIAAKSSKNNQTDSDVVILSTDNHDEESNFQWKSYLNSSLSSRSVIVLNDRTGKVLYQKNPHVQMSLASITKLMAAMVFLDAKQDLDTPITITDSDVDRIKKSASRLSVGTTLTRQELLHIGLMSSENRAIHALARNYPGGLDAFIVAMNEKAKQLGMYNTFFYDPTGLDPRNQSTAYDIVKMARAADKYPLIRYYTTDQQTLIKGKNGRLLTYKNSNSLVRNGGWNVGLQKTGYIKEAGRCMVVKSKFGSDDVYLVFLGAPSTFSRVSDAEHVREVFRNRYY